VPIAVFAAVMIGGVAVAATGSGGIQFKVAAPVTVQALGVDIANPAVGQTVTAGAKIVAERETVLESAVIAVRDPDGKIVDFPNVFNYSLGTTQQVFVKSKAFDKAGVYTYFFAYKFNGRWTGLAPRQTFTVGSGGPAPTPTATTGPTAAPTGEPSPSGSAPSTGTPGGGGTTPPSGPVLGCMPTPSRCGWPDTTNTGVKPGTALTVRTGNLTATNGATYTNLDIRGCVTIPDGVNNVTIRNTRITCGASVAVDAEDHPHTGLLFENVEVDMAGQFFGRGIAGSGFTARRVWWHNGSDCSHYNSNVIIEDSFCDLALYTGPGDPHLDGFQSGGGDNVILRHNTIRNPNGQTSAIINGPNLDVLSPQTNVRILDNLMTGGGFTVYCNAHSEQHPAQVPTVEFRGNRIARTYYRLYSTPRSGYWGPMTDCANVPGANTTVWDEDNTPVPLG
jgi:hypothetical protein